MTFVVFHFEISGKDLIDLQWLKSPDISVTFEVFQFEISGKDNKELHKSNKLLISLILQRTFRYDPKKIFVLILSIFGTYNNDSQRQNIQLISVILLIPFNLISNLSLLYLISSSMVTYSFKSYSLLSYIILQYFLFFWTNSSQKLLYYFYQLFYILLLFHLYNFLLIY